MISDDICQRLRKLRDESGLTQQDLARRTGISKASVNNWENQNRVPSHENLVLLSKYFKVSTDYIYGLENKEVLYLDNLSEQDRARVRDLARRLENE